MDRTSMRSKRHKRPARTGYVSEFTQFMNDFLEKHPDVAADRCKGWSIFWEREVDFDALKKAEEEAEYTKKLT